MRTRIALAAAAGLLITSVITTTAVASIAVASPAHSSGTSTSAGPAHAAGPVGLAGAGQAVPSSSPSPAKVKAVPTNPRPFSFHLRAVDGSIIAPNANDIALRSHASGPLLLFLPATGRVPADYRLFLKTAASLDYHVLGLDYWNVGHTVASTCRTSGTCFTSLQENRFNGTDPSRFSAVNDPNSLVDRLTSALQYLKRADPNGGWSQYLSRGHIAWGKIVVAGHSQGGGEAAYIAHFHQVLGQLTFSAPILFDRSVHASWLGSRSATPASRMFALVAGGDHFASRITKSLHALGIVGTPAITGHAAPIGTTTPHELITTQRFGSAGKAHMRTVNDFTTLTRSGSPSLQPVWRWMLRQFVPAASTT